MHKGHEIVGLCPFHLDRSPSFSGNALTGLWRCFAGCGSGNWRQFLNRLGCPQTFLKKKEEHETSKPVNFVTEATHMYQDITGATRLKIVRKRDPLSGKKTFYQYSLIENNWYPKGFSGDLAPYRYRDWSNLKSILLVEGEKVADYLLNLGIPATTTPGGANNWKPHYTKFFSNRSVIILPDHDPPGMVYAQSAFLDIKKVATFAKIVELPGLKEKEDACDWFEKSGGNSPLLKNILQKELAR